LKFTEMFTDFCGSILCVRIGTMKVGLSTWREKSVALSKGLRNSTTPCFPFMMVIGPCGCGGWAKPVSSALYSPPPGPEITSSARHSPSIEGWKRTPTSAGVGSAPAPLAATSLDSRKKSALPPF